MKNTGHEATKRNNESMSDVKPLKGITEAPKLGCFVQMGRTQNEEVIIKYIRQETREDT
jgi:hypothetical protein